MIALDVLQRFPRAAARMRIIPKAILLRLLAGRMFSAMADACLQSAKRRIEARKRREERGSAGRRVPGATCGRHRPARNAAGATALNGWQIAAASTPEAPKTEGAMKAPQRFIYVIGPLEGAQKVGLTTNLKSGRPPPGLLAHRTWCFMSQCGCRSTRRML